MTYDHKTPHLNNTMTDNYLSSNAAEEQDSSVTELLLYAAEKQEPSTADLSSCGAETQDCRHVNREKSVLLQRIFHPRNVKT